MFAFLVHPREDLRRDMAKVSPLFAALPTPVWASIMKHVPLPTVPLARTRFEGSEHSGVTLVIPLSPQQFLMPPRTLALARINRAVTKARALGAQVVGLGALTAPATKGGSLIATTHPDISLTNGNAFTASITFDALVKLLRRVPPGGTVAIVGATGSIGGVLTLLLSEHLEASDPAARLLLLGRDKEKLAAKEAQARAAFGGHVEATADLGRLKEADLLVLLTSATGSVLKSEHLKHGAVVLDDTQPRNTSPQLLQERPDIRIYDGGLVAMKNVTLGANLGLPRGMAFACMAETMLLNLEGWQGNFSIGEPTLEQVHTTRALARKYQHYGFELAPLHSFGKLVLETSELPLSSKRILA